MGSAAFSKREKKEWLYVKESNLWSLSGDANSIMPMLRLSYLNLPIKHLRYLNLSEGSFETLPESLCALWNLQILNFQLF